MKKFRVPLLFLSLFLSLLLISCSTHIEDTNGDQTTLCSITDEDILTDSPTHTSVGSVRSSLNNKQTLRVNKLSGIYAFDAHLATDTTLTITLSTTLYEGNLRAVLLCDGEYVQDIDVNTEQSVTVSPANGRYQVRLAAESAKLDATLIFSED